jgi:hypothetical protein
VVVETIDFFDDEDAELGPPVTQKDILLLNKSHPEEEPDEEAVKAAEAAATEVLVFARPPFASYSTNPCDISGQKTEDRWRGTEMFLKADLASFEKGEPCLSFLPRPIHMHVHTEKS